MREMRNDANRKGNCFDANLNKTINASVEQVMAIDYIINHYGLEYLELSLQAVALLRIANPEAPLSELQKLYPTQITRAGLKYKLDKIISIYKELRGIS
jgi:DNA-binding protein WhiA